MSINVQCIPTGCNKCNTTHRSNCENYNFNIIIAITIITRSFNVVTFTAYRPYVKVDCSARGMLPGQGHWRRRHFHSQ